MKSSKSNLHRGAQWQLAFAADPHRLLDTENFVLMCDGREPFVILALRLTKGT